MNLFHYSRVEISYDATSGLSRHLTLSGQIDDAWYDDYDYEGSSAFHQKPVRLDLHSPVNPEDIERERTFFMRGAGKVCGVARINARVEPKRFDFNGEEHESEPVYIYLFLSPDAFAAICDQAIEAYNNHLNMGATMTLLGDALQQIKRDPRMDPVLKPRELDISVFHGYGVKSFKIYTMRSEST